MRSFILLAALLLSSVSGFARTHVSESANVVADTIYYAANKTAVANAETASYYRLLFSQGTGNKKQDLFADYYMDGTLKAEGGYAFVDLGNDANTVLDGKVTTYYKNGKEMLIGKYVNGKREGYFTLQMRNGCVAVIQYENGQTKHDYFMEVAPDGTQTKRPLSEIISLL